MKKLIENMEVKLVTQRKKLNQALEQNEYLLQDIKKIKALEGAINSGGRK